jgi:hypothetical protein
MQEILSLKRQFSLSGVATVQGSPKQRENGMRDDLGAVDTIVTAP